MSVGKKIMVGVGIFVAIIVVIVGIAFYATSGLVDTIHAQLAALRSGDIQKAYSYTSQDFQKITPLKTFEQFVIQYPSLKNNDSTNFPTRVIENGIGKVSGTLHSKDGAVTPIQYQLIKENGVWKILGIHVYPTGIKTDNSNHSALTNDYKNEGSKYSIKYPADWTYEEPGKGTVLISGKKGAPSYYSTVNVQTVLTKVSGGKYSDAKELMAGLKSQINEKFTQAAFLEEGNYNLAQSNGVELKAESIVFTYDIKGQPFKQWQIVVARPDGKALYAWAYTAPQKIYDEYLPVAKAMLKSWVIQ